jgi:hypothetical protein
MEESEWQPPDESAFNHDWLMPKRAVEFLEDAYGGETSTQRWLMTRLKTGVIQAVARTAEHRGDRKSFVAVPQKFWEQCDSWGDDHFWLTGDETFRVSGPGGGTFARMLDIRFDPETLGSRAHKPDPPNAHLLTMPPDEQRPKGGAPRKAWWDDLWIEMIRRIRANELHPETAAELQRTMLNWLGERGFYPGEDTLKKTAIKLFKYLQE